MVDPLKQYLGLDFKTKTKSMYQEMGHPYYTPAALYMLPASYPASYFTQ